MINIVNKYNKIVEKYKVLSFKKEKQLVLFNAFIIFKNGMILHIKDYFFKNNERKYSFHLQNSDGKLIIRWDNAKHWKNIATFPHHKHVNSEKNVEESYQINLDSILEYINNNYF